MNKKAVLIMHAALPAAKVGLASEVGLMQKEEES